MIQEREIIYSGDNSIIYLEPNGSRVKARKVLRSEYPTPDQILNFNNEFEFTKELNIPGVRKVLKKERQDNKHTLLLEYLEGATMKEAFVDQRRSLEDMLDAFVKISEALIEIHHHSIIHKDINNSNILWIEEQKQPVIIDFGISTKLNLKTHHLGNPDRLQGTLAFMPPEQTGRVNRKIDHRSDLYSLGISMFQVLTGEVPFQASDSLELVHFQIAKSPVPVNRLNKKVPKVVAQIVSRLLEKDAENRYQSARGLKHDLERCLADLRENKKVREFKLGSNDFSSRFAIPQKLYGRTKELRTLLKAFERVGNGATELFMVDGYSGVGKSALISELYRPITSMRGYFVSGKFDQYQHNVPYFGITQAFEEFCELLLTESPEKLNEWKETIQEAVGENGAVLIDLIPGLEKIIGPQPEVPNLLAQEAQNRFLVVFQRFIRKVSQEDHPFVLFLDDLQWADIGSLNLLKQLVADIQNPYFMVIGAYRNNEIGPGHPLPKVVKMAKESGGVVNEIHLASLHKKDVRDLIHDTLRSEGKSIDRMTEIIYAKTQGNAFFTREFIRSMYFKGNVKFNREKGRWDADIKAIEQMQVSENVVDLMVSKIKELPDDSQRVLQLSSCIGGAFSLDMLSELNGKSGRDTLQELWLAVNEHLVRPIGDSYKFLEIDERDADVKIEFEFSHDRIQQAAYSLLESEKQKAYHLQIGNILKSRYSDGEIAFDVVNQLNAGQELITNSEELFELSRFNLDAALQARDSGANVAALEYVEKAMELFSGLNMEEDYEFEKTLYIGLAEIQFLNGKVEESMEGIDKSIAFVKSVDEKAELYAMSMRNRSLINDNPAAIQIAREALKVLDFDLPDGNYNEVIPGEMGKIIGYFTENDISETHKREVMTDNRILSIMKILDYLSEPSYVGGETDLWILHVLYKVNLTNEYGITSQGGYAMTELGLIFFILGNYQFAYPSAEVSMKIVEMFSDSSPKHLSRSGHLFTNYNTPWVKHIKETLDLNRHYFQVSLDTGELVFTGYLNFFIYCNDYYWGSRPIAEFLKTIDGDIALGRKINMVLSYHSLTGLKLNLMFLSENSIAGRKHTLDIKGLSEKAFIEQCASVQDYYSMTTFQVFKSLTMVLMGEYKEALKCCEQIMPLIGVITGMVSADGIFRFVYGLSLLKTAQNVKGKKRDVLLEKVDGFIAQLKVWSDNCLPNFEHKYLLLLAEKEAFIGNDMDAMENYNLAIASASENEFDRESALAHKLTGEFWLKQKRKVYAKPHISESYYLFKRLGYSRPANQMLNLYPEFITKVSDRGETSTMKTTTLMPDTSTTQVLSLDYLSIVKSSQAFSSEIQLDKLLVKMLNIVIENAGGQRALLVLKRNDKWKVEAEFDVEHNEMEVLLSREIEDYSKMPVSIVNYVIRSGNEVFSSEKSHQHLFERDTYLKKFKPASFIVIPLKYQGQIRGILYLEHFGSKAAFTEKGKDMLRFLSSQMAISIDNASLYGDLSLLNKTYQRFVPYEFINALGKGSILDIELGDQIHQDMNVMFCDIRSYSLLAEGMTPRENFNFINAYLKRVGPIIRKYGGFINHYFGDGFIALFKDSSKDAVAGSS